MRSRSPVQSSKQLQIASCGVPIGRTRTSAATCRTTATWWISSRSSRRTTSCSESCCATMPPDSMDSTTEPRKTAIVVSAHSADFVWRAGGAIALYAERGWKVTVVCLSFGERGESAKLWREPNMTVERVKSARRDEAVRAAEILGAQTIFLDVGDYPMRVSEEVLYRLAGIFRDLRPEFILTHSLEDPYNFDHPLASHVAQEARIVAQAHGHEPAGRVLGAP